MELATYLICLSAFFTFINIRFLKLPSTIGLMILALVLSVFVQVSGFISADFLVAAKQFVADMDFQDVLLKLMLSFLLFAGAMQIDLRVLKEEKWPVLVLATVGTLLSTFIVAFLTYYILPVIGLEVPLMHCLLFGALISPTDPIAVLALVKKFNVSKNLEIKIAGESLFNDGVGVVVFLTLLSIAGFGHGGHDFGAMDVVTLFGQEVIGGVALGCLLGWGGFWLLEEIDNSHTELEVLVTLSLVMGGSLIAEALHLSAPLAMVVLGLFLSNQGRSEGKEQATGEYVYKFWHLMDETLNAVLFILIGLEMILIPFSGTNLLAGVLAVFIVLTGRFMGVATPIKLLLFKRKFQEGTISILTWGGLRGGISVALALSLPGGTFTNIILTMTYTVVVFSIIVQGLTIPKLIKRFH